MDPNEAATLQELIPSGNQPVGGQQALVAALARQKAMQAQAAVPPGQGQLTPMGSKSPEQRAKEQMLLAAILRARDGGR